MRFAGMVVLLLFSARAVSQVQPDSLSLLKGSTTQDSTRSVNAPPILQTKQLDTLSTKYTSTKSPGIALALSAVLPGAGQFYNESYWKIPILLGFGYYFASRWIDNNDSTKHYRDLYLNSFTAQAPNGNSRMQELREFYKNQRDTFSWYIFIYYIVNLVDAYVDASLYDFNVGDDLSIRVRPDFDFQRAQTPQLSIKVRF